ncbi:chromosome segregation protein SMC [Heliorestis convoluta]|uniref:Chromosome partition protein Smc n=1 Tax=Heliorestis convoluta TaxID=356322 RepID=A0A5Q2N2M3_9FIRM|nr:chromosome segregation protein SMC [Heliorestis convoluta]QGG48123.1 chromosome segregation protein SMC [Heliorestis convoluta]
MVLKRIELNGFKSFADKTEILLSPGVTVIVGPNGSGKSNVSDAIRWVLGEQSARSLRGSKMEDVIFAGSERRKPVGMAEVSIHLDNDQGKLPVEYREVLVTRRVYRSGESDYLLNRSTCRLRDIHELFADTGLGREGISIIGQGRVDEVLSSRPEERRAFIEEAAGIVKYRNRKNDALKKMEDTQNHIVRVEDIIDELEQQHQSLTEQARKARLFQEMDEKVNRLEQALLAIDYEEVKTKKEQLEHSFQTLQDGLLQTESTLAKVEQEESTTALLLKKAEEALAEARQNRHDHSESLLTLKNKLEVLQERMKGLKAQKEMLQQELEENQKSFAELTKRAEIEEDNEKNIIGKLLFLEQEVQQRQEQGSQWKEAVVLGEQKLQDLLMEAQQKDEEADRVRQQIHEIELTATRQEEQEKTFAESLQRALTRVKEWDKEKSDLQVEQEKLFKKDKELQKESVRVKEELAALQKEGEEIEHTLTETMRRWQEMIGRIKALENMERSYEGFNKGVKEVMLEAKKNPSTLQGIFGLVSELIEVPVGYERAYQVALGSAMQNIVVENDGAAQEAIEFLKKYNKGRATFLPLKSLQVYGSLQQDFLAQPGVLGCAADLVQVDPSYSKAIQFLLGRTLILENLTSALVLARQKKCPYKLVTLQGEVLQPGGSVTGGTVNPQGGQTFLRRRELTLLNEEERKLAMVIASLKQLREEIHEQRHRIAQQSVELEKEGAALQLHLSSKESALERLQESIEQEQLFVDQALKDQRQCEQDRLQLHEEKAKLETLMNHLQVLKKELERFYQQQREALDQLRLSGEEENRTLTDKQLQRARLEEELKSVTASLRFNKERIEKLLQEKQQKSETALQWEEMILSCDESYQEIEKKVLQDLLEEQSLLEKVKDRQQSYQELRIELDQIMEQKKPLMEKIAAKSKELHQIEIALTKAVSEEKTILLKLQEKWSLSQERITEMEKPWLDRKSYQKEIAVTKGALKELGTVNMLAIEEEKNLQERMNFLRQQQEDLKTAKDSLEQVIREIEEIMIQRFGQAFQEINEHFAATFADLFQGGQAELVLTQPDNLLETGVDMVAQPPGKKRVPLSLLSGGERALTAIALLFSLLKTKPSPFCVLDEIEAALDEANVARFANYLKKLSRKSQFIVISHRKGTMEAADYLYGVTMEEGGVSRLVSVKMTERDNSTIDAAS